MHKLNNFFFPYLKTKPNHGLFILRVWLDCSYAVKFFYSFDLSPECTAWLLPLWDTLIDWFHFKLCGFMLPPPPAWVPQIKWCNSKVPILRNSIMPKFFRKEIPALTCRPKLLMPLLVIRRKFNQPIPTC